MSNEPQPQQQPSRLALRLEETARSLGLSRRTVERMRSAGQFPAPDVVIGGRTPLWRPASLEKWLDAQSRN